MKVTDHTPIMVAVPIKNYLSVLLFSIDEKQALTHLFGTLVLQGINEPKAAPSR